MGIRHTRGYVGDAIRHARRSLWRRPAVTVTALLSLALGLGATIAITTVIDGVLLRSLPYPRPDRLYSVSATLRGPDGQPMSFVLSAIEFLRLRTHVASLEQVEAMTTRELALSEGGQPETVRGGAASAGYLRLFGLQPVVGRDFTEEEDQNRARVVILDGGLWQRRFGGDPTIVGRTVSIDAVPHVIIGVTPAGYRPQLQRVDAWIPLGADVDPARPGLRNLLGAARLRAEANESQAIAEVQGVQAGIAREFPQSHGRAEVVLRDLHETLYGPYRPALWLLMGGVTFLLLIACTNVANLAIGRVTERRAEIALRRCIGASTGRILIEQLVEGIVLVVLGGALGAALGLVAVPSLLAIYPGALPSDFRADLNVRLVSIIVAVLSVSIVLCAVVPAWRACSLPAIGVLASATSPRSAGSARDRKVRQWLLAIQVGFAVALLSIAGLVGASLQRLQRTHPGFDSTNVLSLQLAPPARYPDPTARAAFVDRVVARLRELPGVVAVGTTQTTWQLLSSMQTGLEVDGHVATRDERLSANMRHITPGYFDALRVPVLDGRAFNDRDRIGAEPVAVVNQSFADRYWSGGRAIGRRVRRGGANAPWLTVVGVVPDAMDAGLGADIGPTLYVPYLQQNTPTARVTIVLRTERDPAPLALDAQQAIWSVDPSQAVDGVRSLAQIMDETTAQPRFRATLLTVFALLGLILAAIGVYGVAAYAAAQRRREIGVRLAVGANRNQIVRLLVRQALWPVIGGTLAGFVVAGWSLRWLQALLYQSSPRDMAFVIGAAAMLCACALVATWLPARRNVRLAPLEVLRGE